MKVALARARSFPGRPWPALALAVAGLLEAAAAAEPPDPSPPLESLRVYPPEIHLTTRRDRQSLLVQALLPGGVTRDVTAESEVAAADPSLARFHDGTFAPEKDGTTEVRVAWGGKAVTVPLTVRDAAAERPVSFGLDAMPVFMRAGCNSGSCHGAARGKDGFRLSLFGFDPAGDYHRITREMPGRRLNLALVHESLILKKGAGKVTHTGGQRFSEESELYRTLQSWIEAGAPPDPEGVARPVAVDFYPPEAVLEGEGTAHRLVVRARYSDGTDRDVTRLACFSSSNDRSARVSPDGVVTAGARGEAFVMARFETFTVGGHFIVLHRGLESEPGDWPENNFIDTLVHRKLRKLRITPSEPASDEVFLRRAYLDIAGLLPAVEEYRRFLEDPNPGKREALVDELLGRKEFVELWVMKWAELLQIRSSERVSTKAMLLYYEWLKQRIAGNVPVDVMVRELLSAEGGTFENAATNYYQAETDTLKVAENVAQVFLGMRLQCAQCHNHPFDRWTQDDYYGFAAFFAQIGRKQGEDPRETVVFDQGSGEVRHPVGGRVVAPKLLGGPVPDVQGKDRRRVLAEWLTSPQNPYFARNLANIVWAHFFGRGIVEEADDVRVSNPPSNPELLEELARRFTEYRYDFKRLVRDICTSWTYQRSTATNASNCEDERNFSHALVRRIRAEVLLDCLSQVSDTKEKFRGLPLGARAVQIADGATTTYFLTTFGRASRETPCSCEVKLEPTLSQALHLLNGATVEHKITEGGLVERRLAAGKTPQEIVEELTIRALARPPAAAELAKLEELLKGGGDPRAVLEDTFWALLNSREFVFNH